MSEKGNREIGRGREGLSVKKEEESDGGRETMSKAEKEREKAWDGGREERE